MPSAIGEWVSISSIETQFEPNATALSRTSPRASYETFDTLEKLFGALSKTLRTEKAVIRHFGEYKPLKTVVRSCVSWGKLSTYSQECDMRLLTTMSGFNREKYSVCLRTQFVFFILRILDKNGRKYEFVRDNKIYPNMILYVQIRMWFSQKILKNQFVCNFSNTSNQFVCPSRFPARIPCVQSSPEKQTILGQAMYKWFQVLATLCAGERSVEPLRSEERPHGAVSQSCQKPPTSLRDILEVMRKILLREGIRILSEGFESGTRLSQ